MLKNISGYASMAAFKDMLKILSSPGHLRFPTFAHAFLSTSIVTGGIISSSDLPMGFRSWAVEGRAFQISSSEVLGRLVMALPGSSVVS